MANCFACCEVTAASVSRNMLNVRQLLVSASSRLVHMPGLVSLHVTSSECTNHDLTSLLAAGFLVVAASAAVFLLAFLFIIMAAFAPALHWTTLLPQTVCSFFCKHQVCHIHSLA